MYNAELEYAENFLKIGLYSQAFEAFMALEVGSLECTFLAPCKMALDGLLNPSQLSTLFDELEREVGHSNAQAIYNYGIVKSHYGDVSKATALLQMALNLGVPEARGALSRLLMR